MSVGCKNPFVNILFRSQVRVSKPQLGILKKKLPKVLDVGQYFLQGVFSRMCWFFTETDRQPKSIAQYSQYWLSSRLGKKTAHCSKFALYINTKCVFLNTLKARISVMFPKFFNCPDLKNYLTIS